MHKLTFSRRDHKYITLKLCRSDAPHISREIQAYRHISTITGRHAGGGLCRKMLDSFEFHANEQKYPCIVHEPLGMSLRTLRKNCINERLPEDVLKLTLIHILLAVDFLHSKAQMIHAGITLSSAHYLFLFTDPAKICKRTISYLESRTGLS